MELIELIDSLDIILTKHSKGLKIVDLCNILVIDDIQKIKGHERKFKQELKRRKHGIEAIDSLFEYLFLYYESYVNKALNIEL